MYKILKAEKLSENIFLMDVHAPRVASHCEPGQFVIVKMDEKGERIPLTICDYDREAGTITIVVQEVGASTVKMSELKAGDSFRDFVGPLGCASEFVEEDIEELKKQKILFVAGGLGTAPVYPQVKWLHEHGVDADVIIGAKTKDLVIMEKEMEAVAGNLYVTTDDGSYGRSGMVTQVIKDLVEKEGKHYDKCVAIGPMIMMKFVCLLTKELNLPTIVSMNPVMVDGTGMCGACRLQVGDEITVRGPYGNHFPVEDKLKGKNLLFIAGGIGLAPLRSVINYVLDNRADYGTVDILYGSRSADDLVQLKEIQEVWMKAEGVNVYLTIDREQEGWDGHVGFVPSYLKEIGFDTNKTALVCGPPIMIKFVLAGLEELGFSREQVYTTLELRMKCGIGKCGRCNIGSKYVCKDGPVFRCDEIDELPAEY